jgi:uncharacterized HAD superfamily protein
LAVADVVVPKQTRRKKKQQNIPKRIVPKSIAVDLDGVLADTHSYILRRLGLAPDINQITSWEWFIDNYGERFWTEYRRSWQNFEDIKMTDNTVPSTMEKLLNLGWKVDILTARDSDLREYTQRWLVRNDISFSNLVIIERHSDKASYTDDYMLFVDDNPTLAETLGSKLIIYDRPWNKSVSPEIRRIYILEELLTIVGG